MCRLSAFFLLLILSFGEQASAQDTTDYYQTYNRQITGRVFLSNKFTNLNLRGDNYSLKYKPVTSYNIGLGFTYQWLTINVGYGFGFINPNLDKKKTRSIDLQFHPYGRKIAIDVLGQFYRGFKLPSQDELREDIRVNVVGATAQYIFNHDEFSYRAAFLQSEWQKRSAGSWLAGFEFYTGGVKGDSSIVPNASVRVDKLKSVSFFEIGPSVGYAYTYVYREHFFATGSLSVSLDVGFNTSTTEESKERSSGFSPNSLFKIFAGYNSSKWAITGIYLNNGVRLAPTFEDKRFVLNTGNFRVHFAYRFKPGKSARKLLEPVNRVKTDLEN
ncbi:MAG TPA: DUF4421 domain-containing protein [Cyclobacteriaceae bacterium]